MYRFNTSVEFGLPDQACRAQILQQYAKHLKEEELATIAEVTPGLAGRDLKDLSEQAERRWASKVPHAFCSHGHLNQFITERQRHLCICFDPAQGFNGPLVCYASPMSLRVGTASKPIAWHQFMGELKLQCLQCFRHEPQLTVDFAGTCRSLDHWSPKTSMNLL